MKLWILSDLHQEFAKLAWRPDIVPGHDVLVLAGDIHASCRQALEYARSLTDRPVVFVAGNHEFWMTKDTMVPIDDNLAEGLAFAARHDNLHLLENETVVIGGVRFIGATLWTDFELFGPKNRAACTIAARRNMLDFKYIMAEDPAKNPFGVFTPRHARSRHSDSRAFIEAALASSHDGPTVVVTHHAPHRKSIHPRFAADPLTAAFVSDLAATIEAGRPDLWIHGHVHDPFDYRLGPTRVICNPRGYGNENPGFEVGLMIEA